MYILYPLETVCPSLTLAKEAKHECVQGGLEWPQNPETASKSGWYLKGWYISVAFILIQICNSGSHNKLQQNFHTCN